MSDVGINRTAVRELVEDFWRSLLLTGLHTGQNQPNANPERVKASALDLSRRFAARNEATAALMPPEQAALFLQMIDEEDAVCFEELQRTGAAFYRRLGIDLTPAQAALHPPKIDIRRQGIGEMAVRTAVRATIWELIRSLFRR